MSKYIDYTKYNSSQDKLVYATDVPDVRYLFQEYNRSTQNGGNVANIMENDDIRLSRWTGQTRDGKKHSENRMEGDGAFPFEGASDVRVRIIDRTINDMVSMLMTTFDRCKVKVKGTVFDDYDFASSANILMEWYTQSKKRKEIRNEAELLAQYTMQYGWAGLHVIWEQEDSIRYQTTTMDDINQMVQTVMQQNPNSLMKALPAAILDPTQQDFAVSLLESFLSTIKQKDIIKGVIDLRETGKCQIPEVYQSKNLPAISALKPFDEISFPPETIEIQDARVIFRRCFMSEMELRSMAEKEGWSDEFVQEAVSVAGLRSNFHDPNILPAASLINYQINRQMHMIEIVYAYSKLLDEDNVQGVYCTIFCPRAGSEIFASHKLLGYAHNEYPFIIYRRERIRRPIQESRSVPEVAVTDQEEIKAQHDSIRDRTAFTTMPPILVKKRLGGINKIGPGIHLPVTSPDDYRFMPTPTGDTTTAFALIERVEQNHASYFGMYHPNVMPAKTQTTQQFVVNGWLDVWSETFNMIFSLMLQYMDSAEIQNITNRPIPQNLSSISNQYDFQVKYDVRELDTDFVMEKLKAIMQFVMPLDSAGVIDKTKLVKAAIEAIDPDKAKDLIVESATASQMMYKDTQSDIGLMMLGNEANYVENDPSAPTKLQYLQDIMGKNPKAQQQMQSDQHFRALLENYVKNLQMSVMQQQNKQIGKTGVTPVAQQAAQQMQGQIKQADQQQPQQQ